jgi:hypothetical protein
MCIGLILPLRFPSLSSRAVVERAVIEMGTWLNDAELKKLNVWQFQGQGGVYLQGVYLSGASTATKMTLLMTSSFVKKRFGGCYAWRWRVCEWRRRERRRLGGGRGVSWMFVNAYAVFRSRLRRMAILCHSSWTVVVPRVYSDRESGRKEGSVLNLRQLGLQGGGGPQNDRNPCAIAAFG